MKPAAITASLCDWKNVKTRSVVQLILEIPVEQALAAFQTLGIPQPAKEIPVAVALLRSASPEADAGPQTHASDVASPEAEAQVVDKPGKQHRHWSEMKRSQQAGIRCNDPEFQRWLLGSVIFNKSTADEREEHAAKHVRAMCSVDTRMRLDIEDAGAGVAWDRLDAKFQQECGQSAEQRA